MTQDIDVALPPVASLPLHPVDIDGLEAKLLEMIGSQQPAPAVTQKDIAAQVAKAIPVQEAVQAADSVQASASSLIADVDVPKLASIMRAGIENAVKRKTIDTPMKHPLLAMNVKEWPAGSIIGLINVAATQIGLVVTVTPDTEVDFVPYFTRARTLVISSIEEAKAKPAAKAAATPAKAKPAAKAAATPASATAASTTPTTTQASAAEKTEVPTEAAIVYEVSLGDLTLAQERIKKVTLRGTMFLEAPLADHPKSRGHQIDPSRFASCIPVMPNDACFNATGNPYPAFPDDTVESTGKRWDEYVKIGHHVYAALMAKKEVWGRQKDLIEGILTAAGMKIDTPYAETAVQDALRDLALCGYAQQFMQGRSRIFRLSAPE